MDLAQLKTIFSLELGNFFINSDKVGKYPENNKNCKIFGN